MSDSLADRTQNLTKTRSQQLGLWILGAAIVALYSGLRKPIWLDEFLHFAMGPMSWRQALRTIDYTTTELNHGQTGVYMLVNWATMQVLGASGVGIRLPSMAATAFLLAAAVTFFRIRGYGIGWQYVALIAFAGSGVLMGFTGEARPYMPLAACAVGVLVYYQFSAKERRRPWPRLIGLVGLIGGALFHPYIAYVLLILLPFSIWVAIQDGRIAFSWRQIVWFVNPTLIISAGLLFVIVGQLTWMRAVRRFSYDPLEWMGGSWSHVSDRFLASHFGSVAGVPWYLAVIGVVSAAGWLLARRYMAREVDMALVLVILGTMSSVVISILSISRGYWLFERQWVAGIALVTIGLVWFFASTLRAGQRNESLALLVPGFLFLVVVSIGALQSLINEANRFMNPPESFSESRSDSRDEMDLRPEDINDANALVYVANVNIGRGGPVWTMFEEWYERQAGMRPEFRGQHWNWSDLFFDSFGNDQLPPGE